MSMTDTITDKLTRAFMPTHLEVIDESQQHHGHSGWREGGETHFRVRIATRHLEGKSRVAQHRAVMETLDAELKASVHALAIEVLPVDGPFELPTAV
ncbi:MAG: BolA family transcriptional regulator [Devosia sp.]|uniref:BolA family protein n=1 Tax=Devosia sp. TaxID=1871048 RepID=UPI00262F150B|nr:BolA family protein [Devosia sp.]MDB5531461.1 BolA family transcriptional regulator [Devosia sp.]